MSRGAGQSLVESLVAAGIVGGALALVVGGAASFVRDASAVSRDVTAGLSLASQMGRLEASPPDPSSSPWSVCYDSGGAEQAAVAYQSACTGAGWRIDISCQCAESPPTWSASAVSVPGGASMMQVQSVTLDGP
jgi:type II secretory pathway pseudopilin PulG